MCSFALDRHMKTPAALALTLVACLGVSTPSCVVVDESAGGSTSAPSPGAASPSADQGPPPDLRRKPNGEIEVVFQNGCVVIFDQDGTLIMGGTACDDVDLHRARQAVRAYFAEQDPSTYNDV